MKGTVTAGMCSARPRHEQKRGSPDEYRDPDRSEGVRRTERKLGRRVVYGGPNQQESEDRQHRQDRKPTALTTTPSRPNRTSGAALASRPTTMDERPPPAAQPALCARRPTGRRPAHVSRGGWLKRHHGPADEVPAPSVSAASCQPRRMGSAPTVSVVLIAQRKQRCARCGRSTPWSSRTTGRSRSCCSATARPLQGLPCPPDDGVSLRTGTTDTNLGVAGGRNAAARLARGTGSSSSTTTRILRPGCRAAAVGGTRAARTGAVAFRVIDPDTDATAVWFYSQDAAEYGEQAFDVPWVVGGGNLIRRDLFESLDGFWEGYFREMEEIDFSWRLLDAGWRIRYEPRAAIEHSERTNAITATPCPATS